MAQCRACRAEIMFIKTAKGTSIPVDPEQVTYWAQKGGSKKIVTPNGEVVSAETEGMQQAATGIGYVSHFATCPCADQFRKPRKSDRKKG